VVSFVAGEDQDAARGHDERNDLQAALAANFLQLRLKKAMNIDLLYVIYASLV
jgi:hypothetical protein